MYNSMYHNNYIHVGVTMYYSDWYECFPLHKEPMRAEGPKERPTTHSSSKTMLSAEPGLAVHPNHVQICARQRMFT